MESLSAGSGSNRGLALVVGTLGVVTLVGFALAGPTKPLGMVAAAAVGIAIVSALPRPPWGVVLPFLPLLLLTPQINPGYYVFDAVVLGLGALALLRTFATKDRRIWDVRGPGLLCLATLLAPLPALPLQVVSITSFVGLYKQFVLFVVLFLALRRLVPARQSLWLLWAFPIVGATASAQLLLRFREVGGGLFTRPGFRNFFTNVGWGESNYVAALLVLCVLGSLVLLLLTRHAALRAVLLVAGVMMMYVFAMLFSRGATVALGIAAVVLFMGWGGWRGLVAAGVTAVAGFLVLLTPGGQVLLTRFSDPSEYTSWYARVVAWRLAWERFLTHPMTGIGLNQGRYQADELGGASAHDLMLEHLMEQGIWGGILLVLLFVGIYRLSFRAAPAQWRGSPRILHVVLAAVVTGVLVNASVEPTISGYVAGSLFVWFLAWLALQDPTGAAPAAAGSKGALSPR